MKKKRPDIKQLKQAGKMAKDMLIKTGIQLPDDKSMIEYIVSSDGAPMLPGLTPYLPHKHTIEATIRIMRDFMVIWREDNKNDIKRMSDVVEFFKFITAEFARMEQRTNMEVGKMARTVQIARQIKKDESLLDVFGPLKRREKIKGVKQYFIDSFAVSVVLKENTDAIEYMDWFLEWSKQLLRYWEKPTKKKK